MFTLKGRQDKYRLLLPENFLPEGIIEKYSEVLNKSHSFIYKPIDFLNETIQKIQVLGFTGGTLQQSQQGKSTLLKDDEEEMAYSSSEYSYRAAANPINLIDKTINIEFKHTNGFVNYFMIFEAFFYQYERSTSGNDLPGNFAIDIYNEYNEVYSRIILYHPLIDSMDMLDLDFSQPIAQSQTFKVTFKYSNIDFQFINTERTEPFDDLPQNQQVLV